MTLTHNAPTVGPLTMQDLSMLREMLMQQRTFRLDQLRSLRRGSVRSRPRTEADAEVERSLREGAESALREVDRAIVRLQSGTYGQCLRCRTQLERERLEILPHVALCMSCQRERDGRG